MQTIEEYVNSFGKDIDDIIELVKNECSSEDYELVWQLGGREGGGEQVEWVFKLDFDNNPRYVLITGFYSSYNGTDWDSGYTEVYPREVTVTQYFDEKL